MADKVQGKAPLPGHNKKPGAEGSATTQPSTRARRRRPDARIGQLLDDRFEITRLVARGGMGKIYEALQQPLGRRIALKVMDLGFAEDLDPDFQKRFFLEASTCAALSHPNTIRVFDYGSTGEESDTYFIAMEFIEGETLLHAIEKDAPMDPLRAIHIARQICGSLQEAHEKGVIHRDLKPSNVLLTQHGDRRDFVKVLDFGLVKLIKDDAEEMTKSGLFLGSPNYMSPEQIRGENVDPRSDLYSLGVLLYMALTATSPFKRESSVKVLLAQLEEAPEPFSHILPPDSVPKSLEWLVMNCLQKAPDRRMASVQELSRGLRACEAEIRGRIEPLHFQVDAGHLVLDTTVEEAISASWLASSRPSPRTIRPDPVSSANSLVSNELRSELSQSEFADTQPSTAAVSVDRRRGPQGVPPLHLLLLAGVFVLVGVIALVSWKLLSSSADDTLSVQPSSEHTVKLGVSSDVEIEPTGVTPAPVLPPQAGSVDEQPAEEGAAEQETEARGSRKRTSRTNRSRRAGSQRRGTRNRVRADPSPTPAPLPAPSASEGESEVESPSARSAETDRTNSSSRERSATPKKKKGDLRDPWGD
ncbi:MAG: protein kinase [Myxococcota bacterium]|nr:protein kinase [Myxococcota bacterium]